MHELERRDYEHIINRMVNLAAGVVQYLRETDRESAAIGIGRTAARILADYDEDVADIFNP